MSRPACPWGPSADRLHEARPREQPTGTAPDDTATIVLRAQPATSLTLLSSHIADTGWVSEATTTGGLVQIFLVEGRFSLGSGCPGTSATSPVCRLTVQPHQRHPPATIGRTAPSEGRRALCRCSPRSLTSGCPGGLVTRRCHQAPPCSSPRRVGRDGRGWQPFVATCAVRSS